MLLKLPSELMSQAREPTTVGFFESFPCLLDDVGSRWSVKCRGACEDHVELPAILRLHSFSVLCSPKLPSSYNASNHNNRALNFLFGFTIEPSRARLLPLKVLSFHIVCKVNREIFVRDVGQGMGSLLLYRIPIEHCLVNLTSILAWLSTIARLYPTQLFCCSDGVTSPFQFLPAVVFSSYTAMVRTPGRHHGIPIAPIPNDGAGQVLCQQFKIIFQFFVRVLIVHAIPAHGQSFFHLQFLCLGSSRDVVGAPLPARHARYRRSNRNNP